MCPHSAAERFVAMMILNCFKKNDDLASIQAAVNCGQLLVFAVVGTEENMAEAMRLNQSREIENQLRSSLMIFWGDLERWAGITFDDEDYQACKNESMENQVRLFWNRQLEVQQLRAEFDGRR